LEVFKFGDWDNVVVCHCVSVFSLAFIWEDLEGTLNGCVGVDIHDRRCLWCIPIHSYCQYSGFLYERLPIWGVAAAGSVTSASALANTLPVVPVLMRSGHPDWQATPSRGPDYLRKPLEYVVIRRMHQFVVSFHDEQSPVTRSIIISWAPIFWHILGSHLLGGEGREGLREMRSLSLPPSLPPTPTDP
jgi:hypothetical protein